MKDRHAKDVGQFYYHVPWPVAVVAVHCEGRDNAMAAAWHAPISFDPPLYGISISPKRHTCDLIRKAREFTANFMPLESAELIAAVGGSTGREIDKFEEFELEREAPLEVSSPILAAAYAAYECILHNEETYGDHQLFVGRIVAVHYASAFQMPDGTTDPDAAEPTLYLGGEVYATVAGMTRRYVDRRVHGARRKTR
jgi:flavin reductase (DIM6/NTAB) family NADH-FMN oxidoreductase RutF